MPPCILNASRGSARTLFCSLCILVLLAWAPPLRAASVDLVDLDLRAVQQDGGDPTSVGEVRTTDGLVLAPDSSLWIDLKGDAEEFRATVSPLPGGKGPPVRCRFATATYIAEFVVTEQMAPREIVMPLKGQKLLVLETYSTAGDKSGVRLHLTPSSIRTRSLRPEAWAGAAPIEWKTPRWQVRVDGRSGGIARLAHPGDPHAMQWVRPAAPWGIGWAEIGGRMHAWDRPSALDATGPRSQRTTYELPGLRIEVERELDDNERLIERYTFVNTSGELLVFGEGGLGITLPLFDSYPGAELCLTERCHVHLWAGGTASYVNAMRMGGAAPHLGLVLNEGSLSAYSIHNRVAHSNDRGQFVLHPGPMTLAAGERHSIGWTVFWHEGWTDFFSQAFAQGLVRLDLERHTVSPGEELKLTALSPMPLDGAVLTLNGEPVDATVEGGVLSARVVPRELGEQRFELRVGRHQTHANAFVSPAPLDLIRERVRFIVAKQQRRAPGDPLDGAYLIYDNEREVQVYERGFSDHNAGRERLAMGTLVALYLPFCDDPVLAGQIRRSLRRYDRFVARELQNAAGVVFNDAGRAAKQRFYNYPWVIDYHLAMHRAFGNAKYLRRALNTARTYYARGGADFYSIGMPVRELLSALRDSGWKNEYREMLKLFRQHAESVLRRGSDFPKHEVNFEQSIVGPAAQLLLEFYLETREERYFASALQQLRLLELFSGRQPDHRLHEIAIRHWDGYWFGGRKLYGDTFPHYWSAITGAAFALYAEATGDQQYERRGREVIANNFSLFTPDGRGSAAYLYPLMLNEQPGRFADPWANDQDWALVYWLRFVQGRPAAPAAR